MTPPRHLAGPLVALVALAATFPAAAGSISIAWDPVAGATGYRVYYGTTTGQYSSSVTVGAVTATEIRGLRNCEPYYLSVKALGPQGAISSSFSNEVVGWSRPEVTASPVLARQGEQFVLAIRGANFQGAGDVRLSASVPTDIAGTPLIRFEDVSVVDCTRIEALVTVEATAQGQRAMPIGTLPLDVEVTQADGVYGEGSIALTVDLAPRRCDLNRSDDATRDRVDGKDLTWLAYSYGSSEGEPNYNPDADLTGDGIVDGDDLVFVARDFGACWDGEGWDPDACS